MQRLIEAVKRHAAGVVNSQAQPRWGFVASVDPTRPAVRVELQPEGVLTGWLPVLQQAAGGGYTSLTVPEVGWQACVIADLGHAEHGIVVGFAHNDGAPLPGIPNSPGSGGVPSNAPATLAPGESGIFGPGGSVLRMCADGSIYSRGQWNHDGAMTVNGTLTAQQDITSMQNVRAAVDVTDQNGAHGSLATLRTDYNAHQHPGVQSGAASTGTTDHPVA